MQHFLENEIVKHAKTKALSYYGGTCLIEHKGTYYLAQNHWREGVVGEKVSKEFAEAFIKEFSR